MHRSGAPRRRAMVAGLTGADVTIRTLKISFAGGEVSPEMFGRLDDSQYQAGVAKCRNFISKPQGPAENRPGFRFVRDAKYPYSRARLIPFTFATTQTMVIEVGAGYFRFHTAGATVMSGNAPYEVANSFDANHIFDIRYVQSADVLTLTHPKYQPCELRRHGATNWVLDTINFQPSILPPSRVVATPNATDTSNSQRYVVTATSLDGFKESEASAVALCHNNLYASGRWNTITWGFVTDVLHYNVFKLQGGVYGFIGRTSELSIRDDNIAPDLSRTPPHHSQSFELSNHYPTAVSYFEQRRCFAGTIAEPQNVWMTRSGTEATMSHSIPVRDDDRIAFRLAAREANTIRHLVPLTQLLVLTSAAEWCVTSVNSDALTPTSISVRPQSYIGASNAQPVVINNSLIFGAARGGHIRELGYAQSARGFVSGDLSIRAAHLFDGFEIVDMAYAKAPQPIVWFVSSSGKLLGLTYVPEQQIGAWHQHDTKDGSFESCTVVSEGGEDVLYCIVRRHVAGVWVRRVERMDSRHFSDQADAFFVDCGLTYTGAPATTISGLDHLNGCMVSILADGAVHPQRLVVGGAITLDQPASKVHVGLPIEADLQTLPVAAQVDNGFGQGRYKNVNKVWLRVYRSSGIFVGPDADSLTEAKQRTTESYGTPPALKSEEILIVLSPKWADAGQIFVRQSDPLPLTIVSMTAEVVLGA